jgi:hypothetical protein
MLVDGNNFIRHYLKSNTSFACGKFGGNELQLLYCYLHNNNIFGERFFEEMKNVAGLYPLDNNSIKWFCELVLSDYKELDLIAKWNKVIPDFEDKLIKNANIKVTKLKYLEPYFFDNPWTDSLEGKKVLILSPFADSIKSNYEKLDNIWNGKIKKNFELIAVKYPFSIPITETPKFNNSIDIYYHYIDIISNLDFDVGIFGTGYTGLLFALHCKKINRQGIHLGGATQILFGLKGSRWNKRDDFIQFFNEYWTEPSAEEIPHKYKLVEEGCYW